MILNFQVIANLFFLVLGLAYGLGALMLPAAAFGDPNAPKVYPLIIAGGLIAMSMVLFVFEFRKQKEGRAEEKVKFQLQDEGKMVAFVSVACVIYAFLFDSIGYVLATFLFIESVMIFITKGKKMLGPTLWALGFAVGIYYLFGHVFGITLPPLPFLDL